MEAVTPYSQKYIFPKKKTNDINVKVFNRITNKNRDKTITKHISCGFKYKFNSRICNSNQKWNNKTCQCELKNFRKCKKRLKLES